MAYQLVPMSKFLAQPSINGYIKNMLGNRSGAFITSLTQLATSSPQLRECDRNSLLSCALKATGMGLPFDPSLGKAYAVPYKSRDGYVAQFQLGYKGVVDLALRTGQYKHLNAMEVRQGEFKGRDDAGDPIIEWADEDEREKLPVIGYMAYFELVGGFKKRIYWTVEKVEKHAERYSQGYRYEKAHGASQSTAKAGNKSSPWVSNRDEMACKTVLKNLISKWGVMSIEYQMAAQYDQAVITTDFDTGEETVQYIDNPANDVPTLTGEQQTALLQEYGGEVVGKGLEQFGAKTLNEIQQDQLDDFKEVLKGLK
jgi:recombination protein RecT